MLIGCFGFGGGNGLGNFGAGLLPEVFAVEIGEVFELCLVHVPGVGVARGEHFSKEIFEDVTSASAIGRWPGRRRGLGGAAVAVRGRANSAVLGRHTVRADKISIRSAGVHQISPLSSASHLGTLTSTWVPEISQSI